MKRRKVSTKERAEIFRDNGGVCHLCLRKIAPGEEWDADHVHPLGLDGADTRENMKPAHKDCHAGKTRGDVRVMRKADRQLRNFTGTKRPTSRPIAGSKASGIRKRMNGSVERRI